MRMMKRQALFHLAKRIWLVWSLAAVVLGCTAAVSADGAPMGVGLTPVFLDDQPRILNAWGDYLERNLGRPVNFVQRGSYREITDLLLRGELDAAWLCGLPYVERQSRMALVAVPVYQGSPLYRSLLIVPKDDAKTSGWETVPPGVFAFSDPDSNSGYLYPMYAMTKAGIDPDRHFRKTFFAHGHRNVVESVAVGLADAGAVDAYVWETLQKNNPDLTANTRVVLRSETFGFPPIVARADLPEEEMLALRHVLVHMRENPEGLRVLDLFNLDGFVEATPALYSSIADMSRTLGRVP